MSLPHRHELRYHGSAIDRGKEGKGILIDEIKKYVEGIPAILKEKRGVYSVEFTVAEGKVFLSKKKLAYSAKFRIDEEDQKAAFHRDAEGVRFRCVRGRQWLRVQEGELRDRLGAEGRLH